MPRRTAPSPLVEPVDSDAAAVDPRASPESEAPQGLVPDLSAIGIAGIGRRQVGMVLGAVLAVWIVVVFASQVGDASAASGRAEALEQANDELRRDIAAFERELQFIQRQDYILQQARAYGLGKAREIPFSLSPDAPPLPADAPGSAAVRVGASTERPSPLDRWLELLFGPGD